MKNTLARIYSSILYFILIFYSLDYAQSVYEPVYNKEIYNYLERISVKGLIKFDDNIKPLTRMQIAGFLLIADSSKYLMSGIERDELSFFKNEYFYEIKDIHNSVEENVIEFAKYGESERLRLFKYYGNRFSLFADPIYGYKFEYFKNELMIYRWNGFNLFGTLEDKFGFWLNFRDNREDGDYIDRVKKISPETGVNLINNENNGIEYSRVNAGISYAWKWGDISLAKDHIIWGSDKRGNLIFSTKAPSYPFVRLRIDPVDWLSFSYIHGWLESRVTDSSSIRETLVENRKSFYQVQKYMAAHIITFQPLKELKVSLGESVIYSDKIEPLYLIPIMFFRLADQYKMEEGKDTDTGDNIQLFFDVGYKFNALKTKFYSTLFIDELSVTSILKNEDGPSAVAYTFGAISIDPLIKNSELIVEYSRLNPFVYMNSNDAQLFTNARYQLGHWIGSNGDILFISYKQKIIRGFDITFSYERTRKGQTERPIEQYELPYPDFLYGAKRNEISYGVIAKYQILHELFMEAEYKYFDISDNEEGRTPNYLIGRNSLFGLSIYYGL